MQLITMRTATFPKFVVFKTPTCEKTQTELKTFSRLKNDTYP